MAWQLHAWPLTSHRSLPRCKHSLTALSMLWRKRLKIYMAPRLRKAQQWFKQEPVDWQKQNMLARVKLDYRDRLGVTIPMAHDHCEFICGFESKVLLWHFWVNSDICLVYPTRFLCLRIHYVSCTGGGGCRVGWPWGHLRYKAVDHTRSAHKHTVVSPYNHVCDDVLRPLKYLVYHGNLVQTKKCPWSGHFCPGLWRKPEASKVRWANWML